MHLCVYRGLAGLTGAILTAPSHTAQQPELAATSRQDQAGGPSSATEPPHPSAVVPNQEPSTPASPEQLHAPAQPSEPPAKSVDDAGAAQGAAVVNGVAEQPPEPACADVRMEADVSGAEHNIAQHAVHEILPAVYLQSVLDSWQADGPPPIAPRAAQLLAASGVDQGDFEIYEGSDMEEQDAAGIADDKIGLGEDAQTNGEHFTDITFLSLYSHWPQRPCSDSCTHGTP
jgi:hypothetical protein